MNRVSKGGLCETTKERQMKKMRGETTDVRETANRPTKQGVVTCSLLFKF